MATPIRLLNLSYRMRQLNAFAVMRYHFVRIRYIQRHSQSERFSFADFLTQRLEKESAHAMRTHWSIWVLLCGIIGLNYARYAAVPLAVAEQFAQFGFLACGWALLAAGLVIHLVFGISLLNVADPENTVAVSHGERLLAQQSAAASDMHDPRALAKEAQRRVTPLRALKFAFQLVVFMVVVFLTSLTMYGLTYNSRWGLGAVAGLPVLLFVLVPLPQVIPVFTLLTAADFPPNSSARGSALPSSGDLALTELPVGVQSYGRYVPTLQSPYESPVSFAASAPFPPPSPAHAQGARRAPTQDMFGGPRFRSDSYSL